MVRVVAHLLGAALLSSVVSAAPMRKRDSAINEPAVSAPDGTVTTAGSAAPETTSFPEGVSAIDPSAIPTGVITSSVDTEPPVATTVASVDTAPPVVSAPPTIISGGSGYSSGYSVPSYGSGSSQWMVSYNSCVQTCMATYPPPPTIVSLPGGTVSSGSSEGSIISGGSDGSLSGSAGSSIVSSGSSSGSGMIWNVIVAPQKGVLRFVPAYVTASPGDTVRFTWGAGPHTLTQSSAGLPCNATVGGFATGQQEAGFTHDVLVNDTNPVFFYCGVPSHCQKGMFGGINPPTATGSSNTSVENMMPMWAAADPDISAVLNNTNTLAAASPKALSWGNNLDVSTIDPSLHGAVAENVLYTRRVMAANPDAWDKNGNFNPGSNFTIPFDMSAMLDAANAGTPALNAENGITANASAATSSSAAPAATGSKPSGAIAVRSSAVAVAVAAVAAALFAF